MKHLNKSDICGVLSLLAEGRALYVPGLVRGMKQFKLWEGETPLLDGENTALPPKDILFPKTEKMYRYTTGAGTTITEQTDVQRQAIFGLRPCDARSIACMDSVFLREGYEDSFYARRRDNCLLVAVSCPEAGKNCFCEAMGIDPNRTESADLLLTDGGGDYGVEALTEQGAAELEKWSAYLTEGPEVRGETHCTLRPAMSEELSGKLEAMFDDEAFWRGVSDPCLKCGTCSFVCPTCYCFDINQSAVGSEGMAFRCWDSCMFSDYNQNAGGHNTRPTQLERLRNRYLHKLAYFRDRHGMELCVGCGRCITRCPAHLDITEVIDKAAEVCV